MRRAFLTLRLRTPALISDTDETGVTAKSQSQTFKVARLCVWGKVEAKDVGDAEVDLMRTRLRSVGLDLGSQQEQVDVEAGMDVDVHGEDGNCAPITGVP